MLRYIAIVTTVLVAAACNGDQQTPSVDKEPKRADSTVQKAKTGDEVAALQAEDSTVHLQLEPGKDSVLVKGHLGKKGDPFIIYLDIKRGNRILATITPEKPDANIRFSHIYMPDGTSDGPFGRTLDYKIKGKGVYKIYISPSRMAGDPASTDFTVSVRSK